MEKVTCIATVKNERNNIRNFIQSLLSQSRKPDEIIIVDGGSNDGTYEQLLDMSKKFPLKIFQQPGNRSVGRNCAISRARNDIIAVSDAGCTCDIHWLERLIAPFQDRSVAMVAGFYKPSKGTVFQTCVATYTCVMSDKLNDEFLPSSRSVAFRKKIWMEIGGYPEELDTCEDLVFARKIKDRGKKIIVEQKAFVTWPQKKSLRAVARQFFSYAQGDGKALYIRPSTPFLFGRYIVGLLLAVYSFFNPSAFLLMSVLFFVYIAWAIQKNYRYVKNIRALYYLPLLQFTADVMVISGMIVGLISRLTLIKAVGIQIIAKAITSLIGLLTFSILTRALTTQEMSIYSYVSATALLFLSAADFGLDMLIMRDAAKEKKALVAKYFGVRTILTVAIFFVAAMYVWLTQHTFFVPFILVFIGYALILLQNGYISWHRGMMKFLYASQLQILISMLFLGLVVIGMLFSAPLNYYFFMIAVASAFGLWIIQRNTGIAIKINIHLIPLFKQIVPIGLAAIISTAYFKLDIVFMSYFFPPSQTPDIAIYTAGYRPFELGIVMGGILTTTLLPYITLRLRDTSFMCKSAVLTLVSALGGAIILYISAPYIISIIAGAPYSSSVEVLRILSGAAAVTIVAGYAFAVILAAKKQHYILVASCAALICNIVCNLVLIPHYSYIGASWATLMTQTTLMIIAVGGAIYSYAHAVHE